MSEPSLENFFAELAAEGQAEGTASFTLESGKAREKLRKFALQHPENYFLMLVAGLYALGGRRFRLTVDADDLILEADQALGREAFQDIWLYVAGGSGKGDALGFRLLAIALLTSVRFDKMDWSFQSHDEQGPWLYTTSINKGKIGTESLGPDPEPVTGVRVWAKRKSVFQVTQRFLSRLTSKVLRRRSNEERLVSERVFLPQDGSFEVNGATVLSAERERFQATASLLSGEAPSLVRAHHQYQQNKELTLAAILCDAEAEGVPGRPQTIDWIWNGLQMDRSDLELPFPFVRVFVWAPTLRVDMSFASLVDNRERQALVRSARDAVREMLKRFTLELTPELTRSKDLSPDLEWARQTLLRVLNHRVDTSRNRNRLASFNRALIGCPLIWGSDASGRERRYAFAEIWKRLEEGKGVSAFRSAESWRQVPAWPDRPLVLYAQEFEYRVLTRKFPAVGDALLLAAELDELVRAQGEGEIWHAPEAGSIYCGGSFQVQGITVEWSISNESHEAALRKGSAPSPGRLSLVQNGRLFYQDTTLLPRGVELKAEADWQPDHRGRLKDPQLRQALTEGAIEALVTYLEELRGPNYGVQTLLLLCLGSLAGEQVPADLREREWLACRDLREQALHLSPHDLMSSVESLGSPLYHLDPEAALDIERVPQAWQDMRVLVLPGEAAKVAKKWFGCSLRSARGLKKLSKTAPFTKEGSAWSSTLERDLPPGVASIRLDWTRRGMPSGSFLRYHAQAFGCGLGSRSLEDIPLPGQLMVTWEAGWPDGTGVGVADKKADAQLRKELPQLLRRLSHQLLSEAGQALAQIRLEGLQYAVASALDTPTPLLLRADFQTLKPDAIEVDNGVAYYFTEAWPEDAPEAFFCPDAEYAEYLPLMREDLQWRPLCERARPFSEPPSSKLGPEPDLGSEPEPEAEELELTGSTAESEQEPVPLAEQAEVSEPEAESPPFEVEEPAFEPEPTPDEAAAESETLPDSLVVPVPLPDSEPESEVLPPEPEIWDSALEDALLRLEEDPGAVLCLELESWEPFRETPHFKEFRELLTSALVGEVQAQVLSLTKEGATLNPDLVKCLSDRTSRLMVLRALYSAWNHQQEVVEDHDERRFHTLILQRSRELWPGMTLT